MLILKPQVDDERDSVAKTAKQYREEGNATLFASAVEVAKKQNIDLKTAASNMASNTFLTSSHITDIADGVMEKVVHSGYSGVLVYLFLGCINDETGRREGCESTRKDFEEVVVMHIHLKIRMH